MPISTEELYRPAELRPKPEKGNAMSRTFYIHQNAFDLDKCPVLYARPFTPASLEEDFEAASGSWKVDEAGWLTGIHRENSGGMLYSKMSWSGDVIMEFDARTVPPCCNDLNWVLKTCGWNETAGDAGRGYIMGLGGWWLNKSGMEKYPACQPCALTSCFPLRSGHVYHIVAGCAQGLCFFFADGQLVMEMQDPHPEDFADCGRIGFGAYASHNQYKNLTVYQGKFEPRELAYAPEF